MESIFWQTHLRIQTSHNNRRPEFLERLTAYLGDVSDIRTGINHLAESAQFENFSAVMS